MMAVNYDHFGVDSHAGCGLHLYESIRVQIFVMVVYNYTYLVW